MRRESSKRWITPLGFIAALTLAGCDQASESSDTNTNTPATDAETTPTPPAVVESPASFTDHVPYPNQRVAFEMVRVAGSADGTIKPFYIGKTEVTWEMFRGWSYGIDLTSTKDVKRELDQGLRPSELYADRPNAQMGFGSRPAIGMTRENAEAYCSWLSKKTGRTYRLPTDAEWTHALQLGGGIPTKEQLLKQAVLLENAMLDEILINELTAEVASKQPDRLGLYDLLGNAAEWVQAQGGTSWVRGGHFQLEADQLSAEWKAIEDREVWNASSPKLPNDAWWYVDHYYQGFRLVCEEETSETTKPITQTPQPVEEPLPADLPASFTDRVLGYHDKQVPFEMILIPGDAGGGIKPFYVGKTEVSREMFLRWAYAQDLESVVEIAKLIEKGLRPSPIYSEHIALHVARGEGNWLEYPAIGMSQLTAKSYCLWLSEQTGKRYRLPTDEEWMHVLKLSGGVPKDRDELLEQATLEDNTEWTFDGFFPQPRRVADGKPNKLGLVNLLGNATEWVESNDKERWVRGGHFALKARDLTGDWRAVEDQSVWNETYPQLPPSRFWYLDFYYTGLRLVCEVDSVEVD